MGYNKNKLFFTFFLFFLNLFYSQTTIHMKKEGGVYTVPCKVNGLDLEFIFDTGASHVSISKAEAIFMLKNGYLKESDITGIQYYSIANGDIEEGVSILLREVEFAGLKLYNVKASIVNNMSAPLLLGQTVIEQLGPILINGNKLQILNKNNYTEDKHGSIIKKVSNEAHEAYKLEKYDIAANRYTELYTLLKEKDYNSKIYLYYAAINYDLAGKKEEAIDIYSELINSGYTGIYTKYFVTNRETNEEIEVNKDNYEKIKKYARNNYKNLRKEQAPSIELELYENLVELLYEMKRYNKAKDILDRGIKKFANSLWLNKYQAYIYYKTGEIDKSIEIFKRLVNMEPNEETYWYHLGILQLKINDIKNSEFSLKKTLDINPNNVNALKTIIYDIYITNHNMNILYQINRYNSRYNLNTIYQANGSTNEEEFKKSLKKGLPYMEQLHKIEPNNIHVIKYLKEIYIYLNDNNKYIYIKALEDSLKK